MLGLTYFYLKVLRKNLYSYVKASHSLGISSIGILSFSLVRTRSDKQKQFMENIRGKTVCNK